MVTAAARRVLCDAAGWSARHRHGGTVPLLTRELAGTLAGSTRLHARIYGANTAVAFLGVLAAGYGLIPVLGLPRSMQAMAGINLLAAVFCVVGI